MNENVEDTKSNAYLGIIGIGLVVSIWMTFFICTIYPGIGKGFIFAMFSTWLVIVFSWIWSDWSVYYPVEELERK